MKALTNTLLLTAALNTSFAYAEDKTDTFAEKNLIADNALEKKTIVGLKMSNAGKLAQQIQKRAGGTYTDCFLQTPKDEDGQYWDSFISSNGGITIMDKDPETDSRFVDDNADGVPETYRSTEHGSKKLVGFADFPQKEGMSFSARQVKLVRTYQKMLITLANQCHTDDGEIRVLTRKSDIND